MATGEATTGNPRERDREALLRAWSDRPGLAGWLATVDHKRVGRRYIITALAFFVIAGILAMLMRTQLSEPHNDFLGPDRYNQLFPMHGAMMLFLFALPIMGAVAIYIVPLMVGARNIALPRLNAFSYWIYLLGGLVVLAAFLVDMSDGPAGRHTDAWAAMAACSGLASLCVAVELVATMLVVRAPGMTLRRMPLFAWSMLVASLLVMVAMPAVMFDSVLLLADRLAGAQFHHAVGVGDALSLQQPPPSFGRLQAAVILIPAMGMVSSIVETFSRRPLFGYPAMVLALFATGLLALGLSPQQVPATGLPPLGGGAHVAIGMAIAIPIGAQLFCWVATLWTGRPSVTVPLLFVLGFLVLFTLGAITAAMVASVPLDARLRGSYFEVAQLHYVLIGGAVFPLMGAMYYWFPKFTGRMLSESFGRLQFWLLFTGVNVTFLPMHLLGLMGMPRRVYAYPGGLGWDLPNMIAALGSWVIAGSVLVFAFNVFYALRAGRPAGDNPWSAPTLEWATLSPPAPYNFEELPTVHGSEPLWPLDTAPPVRIRLATRAPDASTTASTKALSATGRTTSGPSIWPLLSALLLAVLVAWAVFAP